MNHRDYNELFILSEVRHYMSIWGYDLSGTCDSPLQDEFLFTEEGKTEPREDDLKEQLERHIQGAQIEIERYDI